MSNDIRALCRDLADHLQARVSKEGREIPMHGYYSQSQQLLDRAHAALGKDRPGPLPQAGEVEA